MTTETTQLQENLNTSDQRKKALDLVWLVK